MILGFFDSGLGGKVVMEDFKQRFPEIPMLLEMDREHCPFGDLSHEEICEYTKKGVEKLFDRGANVVILACNTASVHALRWLQEEIFPDRHILGVMIPGAEKVVEKGYKKVGVLATEATVRTRAYKERVKILDDSVIVEEVGAPGLVPLIEADITSGEKIEELLDEYLRRFSSDIEAIVLACTHFPIVKSSIEKVWHELHGRNIDMINPGVESAEKFPRWMERHGVKIGEIHHFEEYLHALADHEDIKESRKTQSERTHSGECWHSSEEGVEIQKETNTYINLKTRTIPQKIKLILRDIKIQDIEMYRKWTNPSQEYHKYNGPYFRHPTDKEHKEYVDELGKKLESGQKNVLENKKLIVDGESNEIIGEVNWYWKSKETWWMELGVVIFNKNYWGQELGYQALILWIDQKFEEYPEIIRLGLTTWSGNVRMMNLAEKLGFKKEATYRKARIVNEKYYDSVSYGILREEWESSRKRNNTLQSDTP